MLSKNIVKYIQSLHHKKFRDEHNTFIAEGSKVVNELLQTGNFICNMICGTESWIKGNERLTDILPPEKLSAIAEIELQQISLQVTPGKVLGVFQQKKTTVPDPKKDICIMLDEIQDPGNLGTIIRTADWFGIKHIICSNNCADCYNPKVVQSTMGSLGRINIFYTDLQEFINNSDDKLIYAATLDGKNITGMNKITSGILLLGNESKGIKEELLQESVTRVTIEKKGSAESLNVGVAAGIILSYLT